MFVAAVQPDLSREAKVRAAEVRVAEIMGVVNAAHAELAEVMAEVIDEELWYGPGLASVSRWVAWRTGMSVGHANDLVAVVERRAELPCAVDAFADGELTLDQVAVIARHVPEGYDENVTEFARSATVAQLKTALPCFGWRPGSRPDRPARERSVSMGHGEDGRWSLRACLPADEGAVVAQALRSMRDDLYRQANEAHTEGVDPVRADHADALLALAEVGLRAGEAAHPGSERYLVHAHLDAGDVEGGDAVGCGRLALHWGPLLPDAIRRHLLCGASIVTSFERNGVALSVGTKTRAIDRKLRTAIERRDGGCAAPGCGSRLGTEIHHIRHWEDGGSTDTANLVCLCRRHHQLHHQGLFGIDGDADLAPGTPGAIEFRDRHGRLLDPCGTPVPPGCARPEDAAAVARIRPKTYRPPEGGRLDPWGVAFQANAGHPDGPDPRLDADGTPATRRRGTDHPRLRLVDAVHHTDPPRAGPA